jgi:hypothetical protein
MVLSAEHETRRCPSSWQPFTAAVWSFKLGRLWRFF